MDGERHILITGGSGFIGSRLVMKCLEGGHRVKVLRKTRSAKAHNRLDLEEHGAELIVADISQPDELRRALDGVDVVYHLAAAQHEANIPDQRFWDVNVTGTQNMLRASVEAGVKRFIHASTIGVYGTPSGARLDEKSPTNPDNIYTTTKLAGERAAVSFADRLPVVIFRFSESYGPGDLRLLKLFRAIDKRVFVMVGKGKNTHHMLYIEDLLQGLYLALDEEKAVGQTFLLAGDEILTTEDLVRTIADELGASLRPFRAPLPLFMFAATAMEATMRPFGLQPPLHPRRMDFFRKSFAFSTENARQLLGFRPKFTFKEGVAKTARWYRNEGYL